MKKIVTITGGTGGFILLNGLKNYHDYQVSSVIAMTDEGGSTGVLRTQYGVLPPGDLRQAILALSKNDRQLVKVLGEAFAYRFAGGDFKGHNFGNIFMTVLEKITGDFAQAVDIMGQIAGIGDNKVLPVTLDQPRLVATLTDGQTIIGEEQLDEIKNSQTIQKVNFDQPARLNGAAKEAIRKADFIVIGPGSLYSSLVTNLLVTGIKEELLQSQAKKVLISNIMTNQHDSHNFRAVDFLNKIEEYLQPGFFDYQILPKNVLIAEQEKAYQQEGKQFMDYTQADYVDKEIVPIVADIIDCKEYRTDKNDLVLNRSLLRYNSRKLAAVLSYNVFDKVESSVLKEVI